MHAHRCIHMQPCAHMAMHQHTCCRVYTHVHMHTWPTPVHTCIVMLAHRCTYAPVCTHDKHQYTCSHTCTRHMYTHAHVHTIQGYMHIHMPLYTCAHTATHNIHVQLCTHTAHVHACSRAHTNQAWVPALHMPVCTHVYTGHVSRRGSGAYPHPCMCMPANTLLYVWPEVLSPWTSESPSNAVSG